MSTEIIGKIQSPEGWNTEDTSVWGGVAGLPEIYRHNQQLAQGETPVDVSQKNGTSTNLSDEQTVQTD